MHTEREEYFSETVTGERDTWIVWVVIGAAIETVEQLDLDKIIVAMEFEEVLVNQGRECYPADRERTQHIRGFAPAVAKRCRAPPPVQGARIGTSAPSSCGAKAGPFYVPTQERSEMAEEKEVVCGQPVAKIVCIAGEDGPQYLCENCAKRVSQRADAVGKLESIVDYPGTQGATCNYRLIVVETQVAPKTFEQLSSDQKNRVFHQIQQAVSRIIPPGMGFALVAWWPEDGTGLAANRRSEEITDQLNRLLNRMDDIGPQLDEAIEAKERLMRNQLISRFVDDVSPPATPG